MVRYVKIFLVFSIGLFGVAGAISNFLEIPAIYGSVENVASMAQVPEPLRQPWQTTNPVVVWAGVLLIILGKIVAALGGCVGGAIMLKHVNASKEEFARAKRWAVAGCGLTFGLLILSFTVIAEGGYFMYYSPRLEGAAAFAFRLAGSFGLITIFLALPESE
ncbi:MAG: DUF2165 family protein [Gammaproteobacteria bacterium]|nr:DUF2165 family protein [Gammaproteobacteria bacterium]